MYNPPESGTDCLFGIKAFQWQSGALGNSDEVITLLDANLNFIDSVHYISAWCALPNRNVTSLELCLPTANNSKEEYWRHQKLIPVFS